VGRGSRTPWKLEPADVPPVHARVEELRDAGCFEDRRAVVARGDDGGPDVPPSGVPAGSSIERAARKASKSLFQAAACTLAVRVKTPSRSNRTAS
jgi:hypothetical protein